MKGTDREVEDVLGKVAAEVSLSWGKKAWLGR